MRILNTLWHRYQTLPHKTRDIAKMSGAVVLIAGLNVLQTAIDRHSGKKPERSVIKDIKDSKNHDFFKEMHLTEKSTENKDSLSIKYNERKPFGDSFVQKKEYSLDDFSLKTGLYNTITPENRNI